MTSAMEGHENTSGTSGSSTTKATASGELVEEKSNSESKEEFNLAFKDILFESYRRMHVQCMRETGSVSELASLKKQGYALNQQQDKLLKNSEKLSRQIGDTLKTLQGLRGKKRKMDLRLSNLQRQTSSLTSKIQDEESRLEKIRTEGYDSRKSFTTEVFRAYSAYCMNIQSLTKSEGAKREKLEAEVKRLAENLESEKAECLKLETDVKLSEENLETEKTKRARLEEVAELFEQNLGSEKAKRLKLEADVKLTAQNLETETTKRVRLEEEAKVFEKTLELERAKLLCSICVERVRDTLILPCSHFLFCSVCLLEHNQRNNTCPFCRGFTSALLLCQHSMSWEASFEEL